MQLPINVRGLYAITDTALCAKHGLSASVESAIRGGAIMLQFRDKSSDHKRRLDEARELRAQCARAGVIFIINDDIELALNAEADGVHLGAEDASIEEARKQLGADAVIGVSCYASLDAARRAQSAGAHYVGFGSFFSSPTKPLAKRAPLELLREAQSALQIPVAAIGGITAANGQRLIEAGADMLAVISDVFGAEDVEVAALNITRLFDKDGK